MITATQLYDHLTCPHRVSMDAFGDPARRDPVSPFVKLLWERGSLFERLTVDRIEQAFLDLSELRGDEKESATRAAIARDEPLIYGGRLSERELLGEPDLLRREAAGYAAVDIKSGAAEEGAEDEGSEGKPKARYGVQLALYTDLLERLGVAAGRYGYIWDVHGNEVRYELDAPLGPRSPSIAELYGEAKAAVEAALAHDGTTRPAAISACKLCVWRTSCLGALRAAGDLSLLPQLGRATRDVLSPVFPTVAALAAADLARFAGGRKSPFPRVPFDRLKTLQARARLAVAPKPVPYFRAAVTLPANPREIFFDIETDPMRDLCYLHGFVVRESGNAVGEQFVAFFAEEETDDAEREAFAAAWAFLMQHREFIVYHYSKYERTLYRKLQQKYPQVCPVEAVEELFSAGRSFDLYYDAVTLAEWPTLDWSIKSIAPFLGFRWRDADPSGASSIEWFDEWVRTRNAAIKRRILDYNEDDCRAMRVVLDAMRGMEVRT